LKSGFEGTDDVAKELRDHVSTKIGKIARPHAIIFTSDLPKTRSGKIMRRLLRDVAQGRALGDVTTLANAEVVEQIHTMVDSGAGTEE
jgi:acetyl-CoA synthetase